MLSQPRDRSNLDHERVKDDGGAKGSGEEKDEEGIEIYDEGGKKRENKQSEKVQKDKEEEEDGNEKEG